MYLHRTRYIQMIKTNVNYHYYIYSTGSDEKILSWNKLNTNVEVFLAFYNNLSTKTRRMPLHSFPSKPHVSRTFHCYQPYRSTLLTKRQRWGYRKSYKTLSWMYLNGLSALFAKSVENASVIPTGPLNRLLTKSGDVRIPPAIVKPHKASPFYVGWPVDWPFAFVRIPLVTATCPPFHRKGLHSEAVTVKANFSLPLYSNYRAV